MSNYIDKYILREEIIKSVEQNKMTDEAYKMLKQIAESKVRKYEMSDEDKDELVPYLMAYFERYLDRYQTEKEDKCLVFFNNIATNGIKHYFNWYKKQVAK